MNRTPSDDPPDSEVLEIIKKVHVHLGELLRQTAGTPLEDEAASLTREVDRLCNHAADLDDKFEAAAAMLEASEADSPAMNAEQTKAVEIQRETHQFNPSMLDTLKNLFMWRDSPKQRIWREEDSLNSPK